MNSSPSNAESIFADAIEIESPAERADFLARACQSDDTLHREVERLVQNYFGAGDFLESPAAQIGAIADHHIAEGPGTQIGPYRLVEQIGEGGFGVVYLAEQERPVRRRVALKIIKPGMDTRQVIARFEAERQALALMDHPNIAKVLDAGTVGPVCRTGPDGTPIDIEQSPARQAGPTGRPYFVMELVHGVPITEYCDQCQLTMRERLALFVSVCEAVQHAHQKGVIHRDIKPTNVLVAIQDGRPAPKIIDFGVAKAIHQRLTEHTLLTGFVQMIGTPMYMSPEQAELSPLGVDTRTDIYSLGVLLYELLTGTTPFEKDRLHRAVFDEFRRIIREEEPPRPSWRLSTLSADLASTVAQHRRSEPRRLMQHMRGELDWIVMKCLEKDRDRRYETADGLARDIQSYLSDDPVQACPPSARYRLSKFARRNRGVLLAASLVSAALIVGTAASALWAVRAIDAEMSADDARTKAEASFQKARQAVDDMYTQVAERWLSQQPQMEPLQREFLQKALEFYTESAQRTSAAQLSSPKSEPAVRFETARAYHRVAEIQHRLGQPAESEHAFRQAVDRLQDLADEIPADVRYRSELAATLHQLGVLLGDTGRYSEGEAVHRRALAIEQKLAAESPAVAERRARLGRAHWFIGQVLLHLRRRAEAEAALRSALAIQNKLAADSPAVPEHRHHLAQTHLRLAQALGHQDRFDEYQQALREAAGLLESLADEFPTLPAYRNELANVYYWTMRNLPAKEAEQFLRRALALQEKLAAEYPSVTDYRYDLSRSQKVLGDLLVKSGLTKEAEVSYGRALAIADKLAADAPTVHYYRARQALVNLALGSLLEKSGKMADAEAAYEQAISLFKSLVAEYPGVWQYRPYLRQAYDNFASLLAAAGRNDEAEVARSEAQRYGPEGAAQSADVTDPLESEPEEQRQNAIPQSPESDD